MTYNPKYNQKAYEYRKANLKRVSVEFQNRYFQETLMPAVNGSGKTMSGYIKEAVAEKILRESTESD